MGKTIGRITDSACNACEGKTIRDNACKTLARLELTDQGKWLAPLPAEDGNRYLNRRESDLWATAVFGRNCGQLGAALTPYIIDRTSASSHHRLISPVVPHTLARYCLARLPESRNRVNQLTGSHWTLTIAIVVRAQTWPGALCASDAILKKPSAWGRRSGGWGQNT